MLKRNEEVREIETEKILAVVGEGDEVLKNALVELATPSASSSCQRRVFDQCLSEAKSADDKFAIAACFSGDTDGARYIFHSLDHLEKETLFQMMNGV